MSLSHKRRGQKLYDKVGPWAHLAKVALQMVVGVGAVAGLGAVLVGASRGIVSEIVGSAGVAGRSRADQALGIVGAALVIAAGIELAYTLFTDGPDEAVDPLILGVSAAVLLQLAKLSAFDYRQAIALLLYVVALGILLRLQHRFFPQDHDEVPAAAPGEAGSNGGEP